MERKSTVRRKTLETDISLRLVLESNEKSEINSGIPFFDHMLSAMSRHGRIYLSLHCKGDLQVDDHHSIEDIGICLGKALKKALGEKAGIRRFGEAIIPMDDTLTLVSVDLSGRPFFKYSGAPLAGFINTYSEELTIEFLRSLANNLGMNLHVNVLYGDNRHHIHESIFKSLGVALFMAYSIDESLEGNIPSTKGTV